LGEGGEGGGGWVGVLYYTVLSPYPGLYHKFTIVNYHNSNYRLLDIRQPVVVNYLAGFVDYRVGRLSSYAEILNYDNLL